LVHAKVRERLAVGKGPVNKMDVDRFNLKKLNEGEVKQRYQVKFKNIFSALENLGDINRLWDTIRENINFRSKSVSVIEK
jgi:hypothetical protein